MNNIARSIEIQDENYFDKLPQETQDVVREFVSEFAETSDHIEDIECRRRDGFIPYSYNRGGLEAHVFQDLGYFWGGGYSVGIPAAQKVLDKWIDEALKDAKEAFIEKYADELSDLEIKTEDVGYHHLEKLGLSSLANDYCEVENDFLYGEYASTNHVVRVLYEGSGQWSVKVLHCISDAPYHRSVDGVKEWRFKANTAKSVARNLKRIQKQVTEAFV